MAQQNSYTHFPAACGEELQCGSALQIFLKNDENGVRTEKISM